ncbi:DEAD/DEAH box helicase [Streptomyces millisiae]|uniref:Helicase associated domain protein n=1 Tax=Streptomyces millisiae TaxID=3075542 RepID=A0ABU2LX68_9ACTN|nr:Helicase associated domain protein [Streptomyces sp. DSM 44918]MDT0321873.1 Helicase associated domain protein [Streptomyces sp. DSM 44918]
MTGKTPLGSLWPHQQEAVEAIVAGWAKHPRVTAVMACGTGKTRVGVHSAFERVARPRALVVVPTRDLLAQTLMEWRDVLGEAALGQVLAICGDRHIMQRASDWNGGIASTNDAEEIARLAGMPGPVTAVATYDSLRAVADAHLLHGLKPWDVVIADEAHRTVGLHGRPWSTVHDDDLIKAKRRLYLTATPRIIESMAGADSAGYVASMDDPSVFGPEVHRLSYPDARAAGLLANYQVIVAVVTDEELRRAMSAPDGSDYFAIGRHAISPEALAKQLAVLRAAEEHQLGRIIAYTRLVRDSAWFAETLPDTALRTGLCVDRPLWTGLVHGQQSSAERLDVLDRLRAPGNERRIVFNSRVLGEGVDAPAVDGVAFLDGRDSVVDIVQALGRALRLGGLKEKTASVIIPVLLAQGQDPEEALNGSQWGTVWRVLRALRAHDQDLADTLDRAREDMGQPAKPTSTPAWELPDWLHVEGIPMPAGLVRAISTMTVQATTESWEEYYGALKAYHEREGDLSVPQSHRCESGLALGRWLSTQRQLYRAGRLPHSRRRRLDALGMVWNPMEAERRWVMAAATSYARSHGNLAVPVEHVTGDGIKLGAFLQRVRMGTTSLSDDEREVLNGLGMVWDTEEHRWTTMLDAARAYRQKYGDLLVPVAYSVPGDPPLNLGQWIVNQRAKESTLSPARRAQLDQLDMVWDVQDRRWQTMFEAAREFHSQHGNLDVPKEYPVIRDGITLQLLPWLHKQRDKRKAGTLTEDRIAKLSTIDMIWSISDAQWERGFRAAQAFYDDNGHLMVPPGFMADGSPPINLANWIGNQRSALKPGSERHERLDKIQMIWNVKEYRWQRNFELAQLFFEKEGHLNVPPSLTFERDGEEIRLARWLESQASAYRKGKLATDRLLQLTSIGMRWPR